MLKSNNNWKIMMAGCFDLAHCSYGSRLVVEVGGYVCIEKTSALDDSAYAPCRPLDATYGFNCFILVYLHLILRSFS